MSERFFCGPIHAAPGEIVYLSGPEMHHLVHVMRARPGDRVILFDGQGNEFYAEYLSSSKQHAELKILNVAAIDRELPVDLCVACALPKGDRQRWLVEKLTEIGVRRLIPLVTERSVVRPTGEALERLRRTVIEASKQCGRNRLMEVLSPERWSRLCDRSDLPPQRVIAHPEPGEELPSQMHAQGVDHAAAEGGVPTSAASALADCRALMHGVIIAVGPEGGFSPAEVALALARGWKTISLGARILRTETAAVMLASLVAGKVSGLV